jgi:hypothetical protein
LWLSLASAEQPVEDAAVSTATAPRAPLLRGRPAKAEKAADEAVRASNVAAAETATSDKKDATSDNKEAASDKAPRDASEATAIPAENTTVKLDENEVAALMDTSPPKKTMAETVPESVPHDATTAGVDPKSAPSALPLAKMQVLSGAFAGRELELTKALTTLGRPGVQVAAVTRRAEGYYIVHVESGEEGDFPLVNGQPIGAQARRLTDNDVVQLAGVKMGFFVS